MRRATGLAAESDDLGSWLSKPEERIYTPVLSGGGRGGGGGVQRLENPHTEIRQALS